MALVLMAPARSAAAASPRLRSRPRPRRGERRGGRTRRHGRAVPPGTSLRARGLLASRLPASWLPASGSAEVSGTCHHWVSMRTGTGRWSGNSGTAPPVSSSARTCAVDSSAGWGAAAGVIGAATAARPRGAPAATPAADPAGCRAPRARPTLPRSGCRSPRPAPRPPSGLPAIPRHPHGPPRPGAGQHWATVGAAWRLARRRRPGPPAPRPAHLASPAPRAPGPPPGPDDPAGLQHVQQLAGRGVPDSHRALQHRRRLEPGW